MRHLIHLWTWPADLWAWLVVLCCRCLWGRRLMWRGGLWAVIRRDSWLSRLRPSIMGVTLGHGGLIHEDTDTDIWHHEGVHVEQSQAAGLAGLLISGGLAGAYALSGATVNWWAHLAVWALSWPILYLCSVIVAAVRGEPPYRGSTLEEGAYSQTEAWQRRRFD